MTVVAESIEKKAINLTIDIKAVEQYLGQLLEEQLPAHIYFHNFNHALRVRDAVLELGNAMKCSEKEMEYLQIAALFHDTGFVNIYDGHEAESQRLADEYLRKHHYSEEGIVQVKALIAATNPKIAPASKLEKIMCDADTAHVGQKKYFRRSERLRKEIEENRKKAFLDYEWEKSNLEFLQNHSFYTHCAIEKYGDRKRKNISKTRKRLSEAEKAYQVQLKQSSVGDSKGARMMFKTSLRNHIDLTNIADQKANIMLSVNALILTIGMPAFAAYLSDKIYLLAPSMFFLVTCVVTMIFATLSTRPIKMNGQTDLSKINSGKTNLFFFGNFYKIGQKDYQNAIKKIVANRENMDDSIINDLYFLGSTLGDKFRYLRMCYNVFIIGICLSVLAFIISYLIFKSHYDIELNSMLF